MLQTSAPPMLDRGLRLEASKEEDIFFSGPRMDSRTAYKKETPALMSDLIA